ncbi:S1C family serine protease [Pseudonocardia sp. TRM90224]|uniref:S1C family serine protease n=1 Tax=Pseudonocardia sp. TRM90224 TaxID=2812678 RepID=UPI001E4657BB|nr:trypsin-like peptidase domain-containing protein [Pseudonocardia sp. TRM90224]
MSNESSSPDATQEAADTEAASSPWARPEQAPPAPAELAHAVTPAAASSSQDEPAEPAPIEAAEDTGPIAEPIPEAPAPVLADGEPAASEVEPTPENAVAVEEAPTLEPTPAPGPTAPVEYATSSDPTAPVVRVVTAPTAPRDDTDLIPLLPAPQPPGPGAGNVGGWAAAPQPGQPAQSGQPGYGNGGQPVWSQQVTGPFVQPAPPTAPFAVPPSPDPRFLPPAGKPPRHIGLATLAVIALVAALIGGAVGGVVGSSLASRNQAASPSPSVLGDPLPPAAAGPPGAIEQVAERVLPSVVQLRTDGPQSSGEGSGMIISPDGLLLTNNHVVEEAAVTGGRITAVFHDGVTAPARIVGRDPSSDLALVRADGVTGLRTIELGNSDSVRVGQQVIAFGSPLRLGGTVTAGIVSALDRPVSVGGDQGASEQTVLNAIQTDAAINPGNSGGPLVDLEGRVIGINSAIATTTAQGGSIGVGFSIPINQAKRVADELERTGTASRAVLGVRVEDDLELSGARVRTVEPGGAAEAAGMRVGDVVLFFGGKRILAGDGLQAAVRSRAPGETVEVRLVDRTINVTLKAA